MQVTKVNIVKPTEKERRHYGMNCLGIVSIIFDCDLMVKDIKLMDGQKGEYLVFPITKNRTSIAFPIKEEYRKYILEEILKEMRNIDE